MRTPQKICHLRSAHISRPGHSPPTGLGLLAGPNHHAHLASQPLGPRVPLAYFAEDVFFFDLGLPFSVPSLSPLADAWALLVSSFLHPALADPNCATAESRRVRPLRATSPHLEMLPRAVTRPTITPPSSTHALTHRDEPIYSSIEATPSPAVILPSPPRHPSPSPIKWCYTPAALHRSNPHPQLLSSTTEPSSHRAPLAAATIHRRASSSPPPRPR
jgi:hypothetical protein